MSQPDGSDPSNPTGVLAARQAIGAAHHPRVPEPTVATLLARAGASDVAAVDAAATVLDGLQLMAARDIDAVAVVSAGDVLGIFSERDHARNCLLGNRTAQNTPIVEIMNRSIAGVAPSDGLGRCLAVIDERRATHLCVLDQGRLVGLLSRADLAAARIAHHERIFHESEIDQKLLFLRGTFSC